MMLFEQSREIHTCTVQSGKGEAILNRLQMKQCGHCAKVRLSALTRVKALSDGTPNVAFVTCGRSTFPLQIFAQKY